MTQYKLLKHIEPKEISVPIWYINEIWEFCRLDDKSIPTKWQTIQSKWIISQWYLVEIEEPDIFEKMFDEVETVQWWREKSIIIIKKYLPELIKFYENTNNYAK